MLRSLFSLAWQGTLRKKRTSGLIFAVLLLSFSCALMALSLTASIEKTNEEYRYDIYGEWNLAFPYSCEGDTEWLAAQPWTQKVGTVKLYGQTKTGGYGLGTMDESAVEMNRMTLLDGRLPEAADEIALTKRALLAILRSTRASEDALLADDPDYVPRTAEEIDQYTLGESITVSLSYSYTNSKGLSTPGSATFTYTLVGVIEDYCELWTLKPNRSKTTFVEAVVTEETARAALKSINDYIAAHDSSDVIEPDTQVYFRADKGALDQAYDDATAYLKAERTVFDDHVPTPNTLGYPSLARKTKSVTLKTITLVDSDGVSHVFSSEEELEEYYERMVGNRKEEPEDPTFWDKVKEAAEKLLDRAEAKMGDGALYTFMIAAVALAAVLCVYLMQLQSEVHSFAVLRSIGITRGQMLALMLMESAILAIPAVVLGIPLGMGLTKLALRLLMYTGSIEIMAVVPYAMLWRLFAMWLAVIVASRLIIFAVTVRTPLTGRMTLTQRKARRARRLRGAMVALLLVAFGVTAVYSVVNIAYDEAERKELEQTPGFRIYEHNFYAFSTFIPAEWIERLKTYPGVEDVEAYCDGLDVWMSYEGMEEFRTGLWVIESRNWGDSFDFGSSGEQEAFDAGELVYVCCPGSEKSDFVRPDGEIRLRAIYNGECTIDYTVEAAVQWTVDNPIDRGTLRFTESKVGMWGQYQVIASPAFFEKFLNAMVEDGHWYYYTQGDALGYSYLLVTVDMNLYETMSTGNLLENFCDQYTTRNRLIEVQDQQKNYSEQRQLLVQELILLYACGGCVALVTLLLLASALAMETEQEQRSFTILRVIGMSKRQMRRKVLAKAARRSALAVCSGWLVFGYTVVHRRMTAGNVEFDVALKYAVRSGALPNGSAEAAVWLSLAMLAVIVGVSMMTKRGLRRDTALK